MRNVEKLAKRIVLTVGGMAAWVFLSASAQANGFRNPPEGAAALSLGGGKLGVVNDAGTVVHNPAAMVDVKAPTLELSLALGYSEIDYRGPLGSDSTDDPFKVLPNIMAVFPSEDGRYAWGVSVTTPYGQSTLWPEGGAFRGVAPYFAELLTVNVSPTFSVRINDKVSLGAGLDIMYGELTLKQIFPWSTALGVPGLPDGRAKLEGNGIGVGGNFAFQFKPAEGHRLVFTYMSPVKVELEGDFTLTEIPPPVAASGVSAKSDFESEIEFPTIIGFGYGWDVTEKLTVGADFEWIEFSTFDSLPLDLGRNNAAMLFPPEIIQDWADTITIGFGGSYQWSEQIVLRAGYIWLESPIPETTVAPTLPDADRHIISLGVGLTEGRQTLNVGYAYSIYDDLDVEGNLNPAYNGSYDIDSHLLNISYLLTF